MGTVKEWLASHRTFLPWSAGLLILLVLGLAVYLAWTTFWVTKPPVRASANSVVPPVNSQTNPPVIPQSNSQSNPQVSTASSAPAVSGEKTNHAANGKSVVSSVPELNLQPNVQPAQVQSGASPTAPAISARTGSGSEPSGSAAKPIVVEAAGQGTKLDVQTVMALQREKAERRLYDRVLALSASGGSSPAAGVALPPGSLSVPAASTDESALGTLMGRPAFSSVQATATGLPPGAQAGGGVPSLPGPAPAPPVVAERQTIRLVSVYARGDFLMAELVLSGGRRIDLEANDTLMGYRVLRVDEGGLTLAGWVDRPGSIFLPVGKSLFR